MQLVRLSGRWLLITPALGLTGCSAAASDTGLWLFVSLALGLVGALAWRLGQLQGRAIANTAHLEASRYVAALEQLPGGLMWRCDAALRITGVDESCCPEPLRGCSALWIGRTMPGALVGAASAGLGLAEPSTTATLAALFAVQARVDACALTLRLPNVDSNASLAAPMGCEVSAQPMHDSAGRFAGYVGVLRLAAKPAPTDSTVAAPAEDALAFGFTLSHDLRAPVRVVDGFTRILKEDYAQQLDRVGQDHLDRVLGAAARMNQMIDAMLAIAKLTTQPIARQEVNLSQLASFVAEDLRRGAPERRIDIEIEPGLFVQGDPTLLRQLLDNLLGNAWKYTQRAAQPRMHFAREEQDGEWVYCVRDNGAGFDMRSVDRLFGLFQRLHSANDFPGTGVGLASVKRIVARHGGRIWAVAEPGRGATFHFTLRQ